MHDVLKQDRFKSDSKDRVWLAEWSTAIVSICLFWVFLVLISNSNTLHLTESVMNMLLGATTLNVLGLMYIVLFSLEGLPPTTRLGPYSIQSMLKQ